MKCDFLVSFLIVDFSQSLVSELDIIYTLENFKDLSVFRYFQGVLRCCAVISRLVGVGCSEHVFP